MKRLILLFLLSTTAASSYAQDSAQNYVLGPGDLVQVSVYQHPDLNTRARLTQGGTISFPLLGAVRIGGLTEQRAEQVIGRMLRTEKIVQSPQVTLFVEEYRSRQVAILGKVSKPGKYPIVQTSSTVFDIVAQAGGITAEGSDKILVTRGGKSATIDTSAALREGGVASTVVVNGDIIYVPRQEVFYVYGEVQRPGEYPLRSSMTVMQALSVGGGLTDKGTERGLKVRRRNSQGEIVSLKVDLTDILQPNDVIFVREGLF